MREIQRDMSNRYALLLLRAVGTKVGCRTKFPDGATPLETFTAPVVANPVTPRVPDNVIETLGVTRVEGARERRTEIFAAADRLCDARV
jgi:hypothetical protein